ncbi:MAG TPA: PEP/pyruvate-binding domain-containing protein [Candidatus Dojkabacteria bacterium]|nr:PEP/pyruvate-binding domain-containing protein [Candidatus Dojkabacteria bacterium]
MPFQFFKKRKQMPPEQIKDDVFLIFHDEITKAVVEKYSNDLRLLCGRKGYSIAQITPFDIPIPDYFIISSNIFEILFMQKLMEYRDKDKYDALKIEPPSVIIPDEVSRDIYKYYARLSGFSDAWIGIRPSIVLPDYAESVNFSGQIPTFLNVRGEDDLISAIERTYKNFWDRDVINFLINSDVKISDVRLAIVVQKMVQSESAGVVFTSNPITKDKSQVMIEAVYGLGDTIADGLLTPDQYTVSKDSLEIIEKIVSPQEWMMVRDLPNKKQLNGQKKVDITVPWQKKSKLDDVFIQQLTEMSVMLEKGLSKELEIEWVYASGQLWLLQIKDSFDYVLSNNEEIPAIDIEFLDKLVKKMDKTMPLKKQEKNTLPLIVSAVTNGIDRVINGRVMLVNHEFSSESATIAQTLFRNDLILVTDRLDSRFIPLLDKVIAVISDEGSVASDFTVEATARDIPVLTNTYTATWILKNGESIRIETKEGRIYPTSDDFVSALEQRAKEKLEEKIIEKEDDVSIEVPEVKLPESQISFDKNEFVDKKLITQVWVDVGKNLKVPKYSKSNAVEGLFSISIKDVIKKIGISPYYGLKTPNRKEYFNKIIETIIPLVSEASDKSIALSIDIPTKVQFYNKLKDHPVLDVERFDPYRDLLPSILIALRKLHTVYRKRNIWFTIENSRTGADVQMIQQVIRTAGFRRSSLLKVGATIMYPSLVYDWDAFVEDGIDYIVIDIDTLVLNIFSSSDLEPKQYTSSIMSGIIEEIVRKANLSKIPTFIQLHLTSYEEVQTILKSYIHLGICGFILRQELLDRHFNQCINLISTSEQSLILKNS